MKHLVIILISIMTAGCVTGRDQQISKANPAAYHYQMGLSFLGERNYTSALIELTEAEKLDGENPDVLYNLGLAYMGKRRPDLAEQRLLKAIMLKPNNSTARNDLGVAYLDLKRWDNAIEQFKIVKNDLFYANSENATINLGLAYLGKGDYEKALDEFRIVATSNPRNPVIYVSLGRGLFAMGKTDEAIEEYNKALSIYSEYGAAYYYLGLAYLKKADKEAARKAFQQTIRIIPDTEPGRSSYKYLDILK